MSTRLSSAFRISSVRNVGAAFAIILAVAGFAAAPLQAQTASVSYTQITTLGSGFNSPQAGAVDGNVYVADAANSAVTEIVAVSGSIPASNPTSLWRGLGVACRVDTTTMHVRQNCIHIAELSSDVWNFSFDD